MKTERTFRQIRSSKTYRQHAMNKCHGGKLVPVMAVPLRPGEKGVVSQQVAVELEPIPGRLITDVYAKVTSVMVPALACEAMLNADSDHPGNTEIFRQRLLDDEMIFPMEAETEISRRLGIIPKKINGELLCNSIARLAHNSAVNYLRQRKYIDAALIPHTRIDITPALVSTTALQRFNAVLKPEDRINGSVSLSGQLPVKGIGVQLGSADQTNVTVNETETGVTDYDQVWTTQDGGRHFYIKTDGDPASPKPAIYATFGSGSNVSIADFYQAEKMDELTRMFRKIVETYPEHGYEQIVRMVHGLSIETGKIPYTVYEKTIALRQGMKSGMDGPSLDVYQTNTDGTIDLTVPVDGGEFGGVMVTFLEIKPEEVISDQPHPVFSEPWRVDNFAAQELAIHPVPIHMRELSASVPAGQELDVAFWMGPEHFYAQYENYGFNRGVDLDTVDHKSSIWRHELPLSLSPFSVIYPNDLDHYPFALNDPSADAVSYSVFSIARIASPTILGPSPVENIDLLDEADVFEDQEA